MVTDNIQLWATGVGVTLAIGIIIRFAKKNKWGEKCFVFGQAAGKALSVALLGWLPAAKAEEAEEGLFVTVFDWVGQFLLGLEAGMLSDNKSRLEKKEKRK